MGILSFFLLTQPASILPVGGCVCVWGGVVGSGGVLSIKRVLFSEKDSFDEVEQWKINEIKHFYLPPKWEHSGSVVECLTQD